MVELSEKDAPLANRKLLQWSTLETNEKVDGLNIETEDIKKKQILTLKSIVTKKKFNEWTQQ